MALRAGGFGLIGVQLCGLYRIAIWQLQMDNNEKHSEMQRLCGEITVKDSDISRLHVQVTVKNSDISRLRQQVTVKDSDLSRLRQDFTRLATEHSSKILKNVEKIGSLKARVSQLQKSSDYDTSEAVRLTTENLRLRSDKIQPSGVLGKL